MRAGKLVLLPLLLSFVCLACGAQESRHDPSALNGNWNLGGTGIKPNSLRFTLGVEAKTVYADGYIGLSCTNDGKPAGIGGAEVFIEGSIAADGSFVLSNRYAQTFPERALTVRGKLPPPGTDRWSGSFALSAFELKTTPSPAQCEAESGDFLARRLPDVRGVFTGTFGLNQAAALRSDPNAVVEGYVSLEIAQGELTETRLPGGFGHVIAANGEITIAGSSRIPSGTYSALPVADLEANSRVVAGDSFHLQFIHEKDGTELKVDGQIYLRDENRLPVTIRYQSKDKDGKLQHVTVYGLLTRE